MKSLAIAIGLVLALATAAQATQVMLRNSVEVSGGYVRLGDLFAGSGDKAEAIVAYAPAPGRRAVFDARWLYRVARKHQLAWRPISLRDRAVVRRFSHIIGRQEIEEHILAALVDRGVDADMHVTVSNRSVRLYVPGDVAPTVAVEDVTYDPRTHRFTAILAAPAGHPAAQRVRVTGGLHRMRQVPVLADHKVNGEIIGKGDIKWIEVREDHVQRDVIVDAADLIGRVPRHSLRAETLIRNADVRRPVMVSRGSIVTIVMRRPGMLLTAKGRALDEGSKGDTIRVSNSQSSIVIDVRVIGTNTVSVGSPDRVATN